MRTVLVGVMAMLAVGCGMKSGYVMTPKPVVDLGSGVQSVNRVVKQADGKCYVELTSASGKKMQAQLYDAKDCQELTTSSDVVNKQRAIQAAAQAKQPTQQAAPIVSPKDGDK